MFPDANATFASSKNRHGRCAVSDPHPGVAPSSRSDRPPAPSSGTVATRRSDRRAAFDNYARAEADRIPSGCVVLALADLRAFDDDVDHELVGRLVAAETRADPAGVSFERFVTVADLVEARRAVAGGLGRANAGAMARPAPEFLRSEPLRALFLARADERQRLSASAWIRLARDARLVEDEDEDEDEDDTARASRAFETSSKPSRRANSGSLTAAGASVIFARARGPSAEGDAALAFSPDFFAALGWAAGARGIAFGAAASSALSSTHAPVPIASSPHTLTSADFGASVGHVDILDETFKHDLLAERDGGVGFRDETEPTGTATSSYSSGASRATRQSRGPRARYPHRANPRRFRFSARRFDARIWTVAGTFRRARSARCWARRAGSITSLSTPPRFSSRRDSRRSTANEETSPTSTSARTS